MKIEARIKQLESKIKPEDEETSITVTLIEKIPSKEAQQQQIKEARARGVKLIFISPEDDENDF